MAKHTAHYINYLFNCLFMIKRQHLHYYTCPNAVKSAMRALSLHLAVRLYRGLIRIRVTSHSIVSGSPTHSLLHPMMRLNLAHFHGQVQPPVPVLDSRYHAHDEHQMEHVGFTIVCFLIPLGHPFFCKNTWDFCAVLFYVCTVFGRRRSRGPWPHNNDKQWGGHCGCQNLFAGVL